jgi:hypothetical protein
MSCLTGCLATLVEIVVIFVIVALVIRYGPMVVGYHQVLSGVPHTLNRQHCIHWVATVWCKS